MNNNNLNFFGWIREGVKQSVLLGVSDAIETIGTPEDNKALHPNVAALLTSGAADVATSSPRVTNRLPGQANNTATKKRLGRSLRDIEPNVNS